MSLIPDKLPVPERRRVVPQGPPPPPSPVKETRVPSPTPVEVETVEPPAVEQSEEDVIHVVDESTTPPSSAVESKDEVTNDENSEDVMVIEATTQSDMEQRMTLRQLRDMCSERNLSTTGKKAELVARIIEDRERSKGE